MGAKSRQRYRVALLFFLFGYVVQYTELDAGWRYLCESVEVTQETLSMLSQSGEERTMSLGKRIEEEKAGTQETTNAIEQGEPLTDVSPSLNTATNWTQLDQSNNTLVLRIWGNESFLWQGAQSRLCKRVKKVRKKQKSQPKHLHLYLKAECGEIDKRNQHGNFMLGLYAMKLAAEAFHADFTFRCEETERKDSLLWWLQSKNDEASKRSNSANNTISIKDTLYTPSKPTIDIVCKGMGRIGLHYASERVREDFRAVAVELLPSMQAKGMVMDDVAIHLRCGDIISKVASQKDKNYGLIHFQAYRKRIPPNAKSIGIVTAPFSDENRRKQDHGSGAICQTLALKLVEYLEFHFLHAQVNIRNDPNETIPEVVSRLVLAQHNFCVRSTFCLLPSIASFGTSYVQQGGAAYFVGKVSKVYENVRLMDEPFLLSQEIQEKGFNATLEWLAER